MDSQDETQPHPVLPWHREAAMIAACDRYPDTIREEKRIAKIIAKHDPHAETVRLLEQALEYVTLYAYDQSVADKIRAHLAKLKGTQ